MADTELGYIVLFEAPNGTVRWTHHTDPAQAESYARFEQERHLDGRMVPVVIRAWGPRPSVPEDRK